MTKRLYDPSQEHDSCGVGFLTHKKSRQTHEVITLVHQALCKIPHRGGMNAQGIGDGAGVNIDLSVNFFRYLTQRDDLQAGEYGVGNFFMPREPQAAEQARRLIAQVLSQHQLDIVLWRTVPVAESALNAASAKVQLPMAQVVFLKPNAGQSWDEFERLINQALLEIEQIAFTSEQYGELYPISLSSRTQVYKGRLNSWEVIPYFQDLENPEHQVTTLFFHTRFSTNTEPNPWFAQPFRRMAHNGELNTDRKNRLSESAIARHGGKTAIFPKGMSDSARLDQTLQRRYLDDQLAIDKAILAMMPPAWENDPSYPDDVRDMLEYFSLYEEKNDGPAALIFSDGIKVGARLDRLGLRPLRSVETEDYLGVMSEAGQIDFPPDSVLRRGRIEAGGMILFDHASGELLTSREILARMAAERDYSAMLQAARVRLGDLPDQALDSFTHQPELELFALHVGYSLNQESFKFMLDPMLNMGMEKISAMGYGIAPNGLTADEGGMSRYFSQRFAQVTNPPLDSIREADGMTLRVALGGKPYFTEDTGHRQIVLPSPILQPQQLLQIMAAGEQGICSVAKVDMRYPFNADSPELNQQAMEQKLALLCDEVEALAAHTDIIILDDSGLNREQAVLPLMMAVSAANQRLIKTGLRFHASLVVLSGQACSTHEVALALGFGASAICPLSVYHRSLELNNSMADVAQGLQQFQKAVDKALMKTMGKFGLCTVESYIGGEFFEANFIDTSDPKLNAIFPNIYSPVGGARFADIAHSAWDWHRQMLEVNDAKFVPLLGLFKERSEGAGHSFGQMAVRTFMDMTHEAISFVSPEELASMQDEPVLSLQDAAYQMQSYQVRSAEEIDQHRISPAYRTFYKSMYEERLKRPAALRDVLALPVNFNTAQTSGEFYDRLRLFRLRGNNTYAVQGLSVERHEDSQYTLHLDGRDNGAQRHRALRDALLQRFADTVTISCQAHSLQVQASAQAARFLDNVLSAPPAIALDEVQAAHTITPSFASGAMSHGALVAVAHEAVAMGTNIAGAMSNSGEGGESSSRYNTVRSSKIKQFASGRFGVWVGYLADPNLEEIEIKIAQGAKPGEGGQLPAKKVNVEIAAARGGTPGVELVSPPPHHDTYSIEDLGQLIHDAKAARVRVIVKLVSSEGIGTIAVGVAKAGADVINVAAGTGGTGAAQVTSLKNTGRIAELGIAEVHQALCANGLRDKITLRCSNAHQTGMDVVKSALLGGDSFEFGTTALMMLKCVMAKNCNVKCPAGLTTNAEAYEGDPRALAQYFINLAHEVRQILASIGFRSLREIRGRGDLLHLIDHPCIVGNLDMRSLLQVASEVHIDQPVYLQADFAPDDALIEQFRARFSGLQAGETLHLQAGALNNCNKTTGGQFSIDIERLLNYELSAADASLHPHVYMLDNGRRILGDGVVSIRSANSAGQSFAAFNNSGVTLHHTGTCNDGVGKGASGGRIVIHNPGGGVSASAADILAGRPASEANVLIGNFALFGATGGQLYVEGQAGDRFGVRNSGAVAVVEGVGDFCCEYMTNGSVVNLGGFGYGFGNGMSGGTAYQYDPGHSLPERCAADAVVPLCLGDSANADSLLGQEQALLWHLQEHVQHTASSKARTLLDNWAQVREDFYIVIPTALFKHHCAERIITAMNRKTMIEELSVAWGEQLLQHIRIAYQSGAPLCNGEVPAYGDCDTALIYQYIITTGVFFRAVEQAEKNDMLHAVDTVVKKWALTLDFKLQEQLFKDLKQALDGYSEEALSVLLAQKRVKDYKTALSHREVADTCALGTTAWIIDRDRDIHSALQHINSLEENLARHYLQVIANSIRQQHSPTAEGGIENRYE
ncbi:MAG: glutamate synthase large subunit [Gammaproteobacteria bacterium]|nr:MAG: glutamate synthase large subunit [Gammaproteobacteria bacterium]